MSYEKANYEMIYKLERSSEVKCMSCGKIFSSDEIEWLPEHFLMVLKVNVSCPYCNIAEQLKPIK